MELMRFGNDKAENNCYINSVLHIYLRIPKVKEGLQRMLSRTPKGQDKLELQSSGSEINQSFTELMKVAEKAYEESDVIVPMEAFRKSLDSDYPNTFKFGAAGDSQIFFSWLYQSFTQNLPGRQEILEIIKDTFEMEIIMFGFHNESLFDNEAKKSFLYPVSMHTMIPELERRYSKFPEDLLKNIYFNSMMFELCCRKAYEDTYSFLQ